MNGLDLFHMPCRHTEVESLGSWTCALEETFENVN